MIQDLISNKAKIEAWFVAQWALTSPPFYGSVDIRDAGYKLSPVDTNLFPAGFNNIGEDAIPLAVVAVKKTMAEMMPTAKRFLLIPESHTRNEFYYESVAVLRDILVQAGYETRIGSMSESLTEPHTVQLTSGRSITLEPLVRDGDKVGVEDFYPCCIVLNNDMSSGIPAILQNISQRVTPPMRLGWSNRLKSEHFNYYLQVVEKFSAEFPIDPWLIMPYFDHCPEVDFMQRDGQICLVRQAENIMEKIIKKYAEYNIQQKPFLVIKADQGTYGMAVMMISDPQELFTLNRKQRTRMSVLKGGAEVTRAIVQEGVYTTKMIDGKTAENTVYLIGNEVIGGFYRMHETKTASENLNSPGMLFQPAHMEKYYNYTVIARLAQLASAKELAALCSGMC